MRKMHHMNYSIFQKHDDFKLCTGTLYNTGVSVELVFNISK